MKPKIAKCLLISHMNYPENRGITQLIDKLNKRGVHPIVITLPASGRDGQIEEQCSLDPFVPKSNSVLKMLFAKSWWWNPLIFIKLMLVTIRARPRFIFVRECQFLVYPLLVSKLFKIPIYVDIRENPYVAFVGNYNIKFSRKILSGPGFIKEAVCQFTLAKCDFIFCVSRELAGFIVERFGVSQNKVSLLANYPSKQFLAKALRARRSPEAQDLSTIRMIHAGSTTEDRGIQNILGAIASLKQRGFCCTLTIVGGGSFLDVLKKHVVDLNIDDRVSFLPFIEPLRLPEIMSKHHIGICSNDINENSRLTIPGKLFEYMSVGLAILSNSRPTVVNIIQKANCGYFYEKSDRSEIVNLIQGIFTDGNRLRRYGDNARQFIIREVNSERYRLPDWIG